MGRMAAYTGKAITWDMAMKSREELKPPRYDWDVKLAEPPETATEPSTATPS